LNYDTTSLATYTYNFATKADGTIIRDANGNPPTTGCGRQAGSLHHQLRGL
jgi:hypothetical protein